jgi:hypothetical protein
MALPTFSRVVPRSFASVKLSEAIFPRPCSFPASLCRSLAFSLVGKTTPVGVVFKCYGSENFGLPAVGWSGNETHGFGFEVPETVMES